MIQIVRLIELCHQPIESEGGGGAWPGGVKFFKFIANFQIGIGYQILGGCLNF